MRVLIADDDRLVCSMLSAFVEECGHEVAAAVSNGGVAVLRTFAATQPEVVLLDVLMPRCNGLTVCHALLSRKPDTRVVFMSGMVEQDHPYVTGCNASGFLKKPMLLADLRSMLDSLAADLAMGPRVVEMPALSALGMGFHAVAA